MLYPKQWFKTGDINVNARKFEDKKLQASLDEGYARARPQLIDS